MKNKQPLDSHKVATYEIGKSKFEVHRIFDEDKTVSDVIIEAITNGKAFLTIENSVESCYNHFELDSNRENGGNYAN